MSVTPIALYRAAAVAAVAAGVIFIGIQVGHPHSDVGSVTATEWAVRNGLKVLMAGLALVGITGMYLRQVTQTGLLGLIGYVVFAIGYLAIMCVTFVSGFVFPSIADTDPGYVNDVLAAGTGGDAVSDIGLVQVGLTVAGVAFLGGGVLFGIALYRARVLARWAAALLGAASVFTVTLAVLPDSLFRFLAVPNAVALVGLGCSLWVATSTEPPATPVALSSGSPPVPAPHDAAPAPAPRAPQHGSGGIVMTRRSDSPVLYEIRLEGHLDEHWSTWFDGMSVTRADDGTTTLRGLLLDQAALHGLLGKVRDLGASLMSVDVVADPD